MIIREQLEKREYEYLSLYAMKSKDSQGRKRRSRSVISARCFNGIATGFFTQRHFAG